MLKKKRILVLFILTIFFAIYLTINVNADCVCNPECSPGLINYGGDCSPYRACGSVMRNVCNASCEMSGWYCHNNEPSNYGQSCGSCGGTIQCDGSCSISTPGNYGQQCNCGPCGCGGTIQCDGSCSGPNPTPSNYGQSCGNCGTIDCSGNCFNQGVCSPGVIQCVGSRYKRCSAVCQFTNVGTDADGDGVDRECGDSLCDNAPGIYDSIKTSSEMNCGDSLDNDCDGKIDCLDNDCSSICIETICTDGLDNDGDGYADGTDSDCPLTLQLTPNPANPNQQITARISEPYSSGTIAIKDYLGCSSPNPQICSFNPPTSRCMFNAPSAAGTFGYFACFGQNSDPAPLSVVSASAHCSPSNSHFSSDDSQPSRYLHYFTSTWNVDDCDFLDNFNCYGQCNTGTGDIDQRCDDYRCDSSACIAAGSRTVSSSIQDCSDTCMGENTASFLTSDSDIIDNELCNLSDSNCPLTAYHDSCNGINLNENYCLGTDRATSSENCNNYDGWVCNSNQNEFRDYSCFDQSAPNGAYCKYAVTSIISIESECANGIDDDCDGAVDCIDTDCSASCTEVCSDGIDNDFDGLIDCDDLDCAGSIDGVVRTSGDQPIAAADVSARLGLMTIASDTTDVSGNYLISSIKCGSYTLVASASGYQSDSKNANILPKQNINRNFNLNLNLNPGTSCDPDCTFTFDNIIHASCDGRNGCTFCNPASKAACDNSQPGWVRDYNSTYYVVCASGCPQPNVEIQASVSCASGTLIKITRIVVYNGVPVKLIVAACG